MSTTAQAHAGIPVSARAYFVAGARAVVVAVVAIAIVATFFDTASRATVPEAGPWLG